MSSQSADFTPSQDKKFYVLRMTRFGVDFLRIFCQENSRLRAIIAAYLITFVSTKGTPPWRAPKKCSIEVTRMPPPSTCFFTTTASPSSVASRTMRRRCITWETRMFWTLFGRWVVSLLVGEGDKGKSIQRKEASRRGNSCHAK